jgi:hypothetical protein
LDRDRFRRLQAALSGDGSLEGFTPEELRVAREAAEARGRELYDASTRDGSNLQARSSAELQRLGARDLSRGTRQTASDAAQQARAGMSGAMDELTFGLADYALAGADALGDAGNFEDVGRAYRTSMDHKRADDAYDEANYHVARTAGRVAGAAAGLAVAGGPRLGETVVAKMFPAASRAVRNAILIRRVPQATTVGLRRLSAAGGAAAGVSSQAISDVAQGRASSPQDYVAAAAGGAAGGLAGLSRGPVVGGAVAGGAINAAQSLVHGRLPNFGVVDGAYEGAAFGRVAGGAGKYGANALPIKAKGKLGEGLSVAKTMAMGKAPKAHQQKLELPGGYTRPDHQTSLGYIEAKFGPWAHLSARQKQAIKKWASQFRVDHWLPSDVGQALGTAFGAQAGPPARRDGRR